MRWLDGFALHGAIYFFDDIWFYLNHPDAGETKAIGEYNADLSTSGMLIEHPLSLGSKKVYTYVPRDPSKIVTRHKSYNELYRERGSSNPPNKR